MKVRLSNYEDWNAAAKGLLNREDIRSFEAEALVDTGATRSFISQPAMDQLGLTIVGRRTGILADGSRATVGLAGALVFEIEGRETIEEAYVLGDQVMIGQTTLEATDLLVDCAARRVIPKHEGGPLFRL